jgi:uncharacterized membrane protein
VSERKPAWVRILFLLILLLGVLSLLAAVFFPKHAWLFVALVFAGYGLVIPFVIGVAKWEHVDTRRRHGQCLVCGYDLRASAERCPECGAKMGTMNPRI